MMLMQVWVVVLCLVVALCQTARAGEQMKVCFWNVENMFDEFDDPRLDAEDILTRQQVEQKMANDAKVILALEPDIIGLMEVENHQILRDFVSKHLFSKGYHYFLVLEGKDTRGIDVGIISKKPFLARSYAIPNFPRGIMSARFTHQGQPFYVLINHWKSQRDGGDDVRLASAKTLLNIVSQEIPAYEGKEVPIIVGGDLNDDHGSDSIKALQAGGLVNTLESLGPMGRFTHGYYNNDSGEMELLGYDHLFVNKLASSSSGMKWKASQVERPRMMLNERVIKGKQFSLPLDDYKDRIGYSDHFPVMATFELTP
jgi:predicted extracellular nuclease